MSASPSQRFRTRLDEGLTQLKLAMPLVLSQLAFVLMGFLDTAMTGRAGSDEQAVVGLGVGVWIPVMVAAMGVVQALSPIVAHHFGAGDYDAIAEDTRQGLWLGGLLGLLPMLSWPFLPELLAMAGTPPDLVARTTTFLHGILLGLPATLMFRALSFYASSVNLTKPPMWVAFVGLACNGVLNAGLIFGLWGLPAMGGAGCGWATGISSWIMLALLLAYMHRAPAFKPYWLFHRFSRIDLSLQARLIRLGAPIGLAHFAEVATFAGVALFVARFGALDIAAHQMALNFSAMVFMLPLGISTAVSIRVGQSLGAQAVAEARYRAWTGVMLATTLAGLLAPVVYAARYAIVAVYTDDPRVVEVAASLVALSALWQLADAVQVTAIGALRGYKVTLVPMLIVIGVFWGVGVPVGVQLALHGAPWLGVAQPLQVYGCWVGLVTSLVGVAVAQSFMLWKVAGQAR